MTRRLWVVWVAAVVALSGLPAAAQEGGEGSQARVEELLGSFEYVPTEQDWAQLGAGSGAILREIAADSKRRPTVRSRAVSALLHFPGEETQRFLGELVRDEGAPVLLRRKAVRVLAEGYGAGAFEVVAPLVNHGDVQLRESAVQALGAIKGERSQALLEERLKVEPKAYLRDEIHKTIQAIVPKAE